MTRSDPDSELDPDSRDLTPTRDAIRSICTAQSFQRGVEYVEDGRVRDLTVTGTEAEATVRGSHDYRTAVDLSVEGFDPQCSCPYDHAGECKHVVAVLLTVIEQSAELFDEHAEHDFGVPDHEMLTSGVAVDDRSTRHAVERAVDEADPETMRAFLRDVLAEDSDRREQFLVAVGTPAEKSVADYRREIDRKFEQATDRRGIVAYDTQLDFRQYYDRADTYREHGDHERALTIYRALAEGIQQNLDRIDDSGGHYAGQIERAMDVAVDCINEMESDAERRREFLDTLFEQYEATEYAFVMEYYDDALRSICETTADLEHLRSLLEPHLPSPVAEGDKRMDETETSEGDEGGLPDPTRDRLDADLLTGGVLDIDRLSESPLDVSDFVGETLATKLASTEAGGATAGDSQHSQTGLSAEAQTVVSTYAWVLSELDENEALRAVLEPVATETPTLCCRYVEALLADGSDERAPAALECGLDRFGHSRELHRFAADCYRDRDDERYRDLLQTMFVRFADWEAYDELVSACPDDEWESVFHGLVSQLGRLDADRLIDLYIREGEREKALSRVLDGEDPELLRQYQTDLADLDPEAYFETYREVLASHLADDTGRDHYRAVIGHLREMSQLAFDEELAAFVARLRESHSNRPALLDELDDARF
ncbi:MULTISPECIES: SWIM zinc finger family protein [Halomicrobium]|uniref:Zinc finger SWIM domain protein n=1 Tax=Halomicrobium mukohataei (strain ATCC 700874 / DSM 12286 / JCM 9738 / NCIMB 13541) TaxID=485914 RepID=C7P3C8_HALMD|nr:MULTISPECIES: SWIM zinc finger family protein [Halomicrobium]ACV47600.1 zinc finger SWIM domain protein [Halomicrobium mukohataei DSM 12286]